MDLLLVLTERVLEDVYIILSHFVRPEQSVVENALFLLGEWTQFEL
jgi:hypothetical protein